jgi:hypothetical protein
MSEFALVKLLGGYRATAFALLAVLAVAACFFLRANEAADHLRADAAEQRAQSLASDLRDTKAALSAERAQRAAAETIAAKYEQDKSNAQAASDRVVADLRAGRERFRSLWAECASRPAGGVPGAPAGASEPDGQADDRAASAGRIVRAAAECDAQVRGLQALIRADRQ